jgi:mono/diheme cytochrome c family protein
MQHAPPSGSLDCSLTRIQRESTRSAFTLDRPRVLLALVAAGALGWSVPLAIADDAAEAKRIFNQRCTACHTYGKGIKVGPDLKGATERRPRPWLRQFIRASSAMIKAGEPTAKELFTKFKQQRMPDWSDLSDHQITAILDWFAASGPEQKEPDERLAETATAAEVDRGRALFHGGARLANGGLPCAACHAIKEGSGEIGGSLAPPLTDAYRRYHDRALTLFLKRPCSPREPERSASIYLLPQESFDLKAYLRQAALSDTARPHIGPPATQRTGGTR